VKNSQDPLLEMLTELSAPGLDEDFAAHVAKRARGELAPPLPQATRGIRLRLGLNGTLVPALLMSAVLSFTAETAQIVTKVYGNSSALGTFPPTAPPRP
jgi:hypothetical protein